MSWVRSTQDNRQEMLRVTNRGNTSEILGRTETAASSTEAERER